jgi:hypothetical protein
VLSDFLYGRFPPALKTATDAWLATRPLQNPEAPSSPFVMPDYQVSERAEADRWQTEADAQWLKSRPVMPGNLESAQQARAKRPGKDQADDAHQLDQDI